MAKHKLYLKDLTKEAKRKLIEKALARKRGARTKGEGSLLHLATVSNIPRTTLVRWVQEAERDAAGQPKKQDHRRALTEEQEEMLVQSVLLKASSAPAMDRKATRAVVTECLLAMPDYAQSAREAGWVLREGPAKAWLRSFLSRHAERLEGHVQLGDGRRKRTEPHEPPAERPLPEEKRKMLAGELYRAFDAELEAERSAAHALVSRYNEVREPAERARILFDLLGSFPPDAPPLIEPKFRCDYGKHITVGRNFYANFDCCILDCNHVTIGDDVFFAPGVQVYTAGHPTDPVQRGNYRQGLEFAKPVKIGNRCWIGGNAIILPGVSIGNDCTVGAGSVVTRDVPYGMVVGGNPARVIRAVEGYQLLRAEPTAPQQAAMPVEATGHADTRTQPWGMRRRASARIGPPTGQPAAR